MHEHKDGLVIVDLDVLVQQVAWVRVGGTLHAVKPIRGKSYVLVTGITKDTPGIQQLEVSRRVVQTVVPTLSEDELADLTVAQLRAILDTASEPAKRIGAAIEAHEKNGDGPAPARPRRGRSSAIRAARSS